MRAHQIAIMGSSTRTGTENSEKVLPTRIREAPEEALSYPPDMNWECIRCSSCCRDVPNHERQILLLQVEVQRISKETGLSVEDFADPTGGSSQYTFLMRKKENHCIFLDENTCRIYGTRPLVCRFYPVWLRRKGFKYVFGFSDSCQGLGRGKRINREHYLFLLRLAQASLGSLKP